MGVPLFQIQQLVNQHQIKLFSSNYTLYAEFSTRVMSLLEEFAPSMEVYSIDEAFLDLTGVYPCQKDPIAYGQRIRKAVVRTTGIPVCVGHGANENSRQIGQFRRQKMEKDRWRTGFIRPGAPGKADADRAGRRSLGHRFAHNRKAESARDQYRFGLGQPTGRQNPGAIQHRCRQNST